MASVMSVIKAHGFAKKHHVGQSYGDGPYIKHPEAVLANLEMYGHRDDMALLAAALLHDIIEDTIVTHGDLLREFGHDIADLVGFVSDKPGKNRAERHAATYPLIRGNTRATALKLSDRLANVVNCLLYKNRLMGMYKKEHEAFKEYLFVPGENESLWDVLNGYMNSYHQDLGVENVK